MATMTYCFSPPATGPVAAQRRIAVFGAAGATGQLAVRAALAAGHRVTAFVADPVHLPLEHEHLRLARADLLDPRGLDGVLDGHHAVLCLIGHKREALQQSEMAPQPPVGARATRHLVAAMTAAEVRRLVMLGAAGTGDSRSAGWLGIGRCVHWLLPQVMADKERQEALVRHSALRWTVLRPGRLSHAPARGRVQVGQHLHWGWGSTSREDVAMLMVRVIDDASTVGKTLTVV